MSIKPLVGLALAIALPMALGIWGCAMNPVTGRPEVVLVSTKGEREIGEEQAKKVEQNIGLTDDRELAAYVEAIGRRLADYSPRKDLPHQFYVVDTAEPQAFALPGGFIYVSRGQLALVNSEDELACVIGQLIGHVAARHSVQRITRAAPSAIVSGMAKGVVGLFSESGGAVAGIPESADRDVAVPYDREEQQEADRVGVDLAAQAGWDPTACIQVLHTLQRAEELKRDSSQEPSDVDVQLAPPERVEAAAAHVETVSRGRTPPIAADRAAFLERLDALVVGADPAHGVFVENLFLQPTRDFAVRFPRDWETHVTNTFAAAIEPEGKVLTLLQVAGDGDDPLGPPRALGEKLEVNLMEKVKRFKVGDLPAARLGLKMKGEDGPVAVDLTWIAYKAVIYQIMGVSPLPQYERRQPVFTMTVQSFRPLSAADRTSVEITRLRIARGHDGETLDQLVARTGSVWSIDEIAVANGLETNARLSEGQLVKVTKQEPYGR